MYRYNKTSIILKISIAVLFIIGMAIYLWRYARRNMIADEKRAKQG